MNFTFLARRICGKRKNRIIPDGLARRKFRGGILRQEKTDKGTAGVQLFSVTGKKNNVPPSGKKAYGKPGAATQAGPYKYVPHLSRRQEGGLRLHQTTQYPLGNLYILQGV
jgi:hypothetical protein